MKSTFLCLLLLPFWSLAAKAAPAELLGDHPLAGTLWHVAEGREASPDEVYAVAAAARWVLIGEKHDNATHHRIQAGIVHGLGARGRRPAVVWEMAEPEHDAALKAATAENLAELGPAIAWEERGWPNWPDYQPIAAAAIMYGMTMAAGDAPRALRREVGKGGTPDPETAADLGWSRDYDPDQRRRLRELLAASHCNLLPEAALPGMVEVQRLRDAWMARVMRDEGRDVERGWNRGDGSRRAGAVLIAGAQHVRKDRGVPWHLTGSEEGSGQDRVLAVAAEEVVRDRDDPKGYAAFDPALFDYVWFTARVDEKDPCEAFSRGAD